MRAHQCDVRGSEPPPWCSYILNHGAWKAARSAPVLDLSKTVGSQACGFAHAVGTGLGPDSVFTLKRTFMSDPSASIFRVIPKYETWGGWPDTIASLYNGDQHHFRYGAH